MALDWDYPYISLQEGQMTIEFPKIKLLELRFLDFSIQASGKIKSKNL